MTYKQLFENIKKMSLSEFLGLFAENSDNRQKIYSDANLKFIFEKIDFDFFSFFNQLNRVIEEEQKEKKD